jgi:hypothetical protein
MPRERVEKYMFVALFFKGYMKNGHPSCKSLSPSPQYTHTQGKDRLCARGRGREGKRGARGRMRERERRSHTVGR